MRMAIERAFGLLTRRWRFISQYLYVVDVMEQSEIIYIACQLHNMCIDAGDLWDEEYDVDGNEEPSMTMDELAIDSSPAAEIMIREAGRAKRLRLCAQLIAGRR